MGEDIDGTKHLMQCIDGLPYKMKAAFDFSFISQYGKVFQIFDDQDSGNICFDTEKDGKKYFLKFAGAPTKAYNGTAEAAIKRLKETLPVYENLRHKNLIELIEAEEIGGGFLMVFTWADGDCMGRMYPSAHRRFMQLPIKAKQSVYRDVPDFLEYGAAKAVSDNRDSRYQSIKELAQMWEEAMKCSIQ